MAGLLPPEGDIGIIEAPVRTSYGLFAVFALVVAGCGLLERVGMAGAVLPGTVVGTALALFLLVGLAAHSRRPSDFYAADRSVSAGLGGLAGASAALGLLAVRVAGGGYETQAALVAEAAGLALGLALLGAAIGRRLRRLGVFTGGDFLAARFGSVWVRLAFAGVALAASFLIVVACLEIAAELIAMLFGIAPDHARIGAAALMALTVLPGGVRSLTLAQAVQAVLIALAAIAPAIFLAMTDGGAAAGDSAVAAALASLTSGALPAGGSAEGLLPHALLAAAGAAALPLFVTRTVATRRSFEAGTSMALSIVLLALIVTAGLFLADLLAAAGAVSAGDLMLQLASLFATLPEVLAALVMAGALAAVLAAGAAALVSAAAALSHDLWDESVDRRGTEGRRIVVARVALVGLAAAAAWLAPLWPARPPDLVEWALAFSAAGCLAPLLLGLWWRRANTLGALAGIGAGFAVVALAFFYTSIANAGAGDASAWEAAAPTTAAAIGLVAALSATIGVSLATPAPGPDAERVLDTLHGRRGGAEMRERPA